MAPFRETQCQSQAENVMRGQGPNHLGGNHPFYRTWTALQEVHAWEYLASREYPGKTGMDLLKKSEEKKKSYFWHYCVLRLGKHGSFNSRLTIEKKKKYTMRNDKLVKNADAWIAWYVKQLISRAVRKTVKK